MLGLTAEFDVKSGYLLVDGEGVLGKQHRGAYDTYTNTLTHHIGREDVVVLTRNLPRSSRPSGGSVAQDMVFAPRKGDRILRMNYRELVPPVNWLDVDPPGGKSAWNAEGRRLLWRNHMEQQWLQAVNDMKQVNPSYVELGRGVGGWLSVSYEPYGLCINWLDPQGGPLQVGAAAEGETSADEPAEKGDKRALLSPGGAGGMGVTEDGGGKTPLLPNWAGMALDSRDWCLSLPRPSPLRPHPRVTSCLRLLVRAPGLVHTCSRHLCGLRIHACRQGGGNGGAGLDSGKGRTNRREHHSQGQRRIGAVVPCLVAGLRLSLCRIRLAA